MLLLLLALQTEFDPPATLRAGDAEIDVDIGHAAPFVCDYDGDGKKDLLVGQFGGGKLRIYKNTGSNAEPAFENFDWFDGTVPTG